MSSHKLLKENFNFIINLSKHLIYIAYLIVFCMIGVLIRIYISELLYKPSLIETENSKKYNVMNPASANLNIVQSIDDLFFSELYANIVGCFIMGVLMVIHLQFIKKPLEDLKEKEDALLAELEKSKSNSSSGELQSVSGNSTPVPMSSRSSGGNLSPTLDGEESKRNMMKLFLHRVFNGTLSFEKRIYTGLSTGMCGCITTFSSWQVNAAISLMKGEVLSFVSKQVVGFTTCYFAFVIGKDITNAILSVVIPFLRKKFGNNSQQSTQMVSVNSIASSSVANSTAELAEDIDVVEPIPSEDQRKILLEQGEIKAIAENIGEVFKHKLVEEYQQIRNSKWKSKTAIKMGIDLFVVFMSLISILIVLFGAMNVSSSLDQRLCLILLVAPLGCLLRYLICKLNLTFKAVEKYQMPIFTLVVNISGSLILVILQGLSYTLAISGVGSYWIDAFSIGFCGSLTTVSTFIQEVYGLNHSFKKYLYSLSSIFWTIVLVSSTLIIFIWVL